MLTRLRINGFKNLLDVDVRFGPFTCIAGANGVGKSNLFDAIQFLRLLTSRELVDAARSIRAEADQTGDVLGLFYRSGDHQLKRMTFDVEMIAPKTAFDRLRQRAEATSTFLRYRLVLGYRGEDSTYGPLEIEEEELSYIKKGDAKEHLQFEPCSAKWRESVLVANRFTAKPYIRTVNEAGGRVVYIQQDGTQGRPQPRLAEPLPRTVLSSLSASEGQTAVVARAEMENWRMLQLEPSALRRPDEVRETGEISADGAHMPATFYRLVTAALNDSNGAAVRQQISNRLSELVPEIHGLRVDRDEKRELLTLVAKLSTGTEHPARSLSDGTLRFLALAIIEQTATSGGLFCLEEPENGIHPDRVSAVLELLKDIAVDAESPIAEDNPLRQVIVNTHSPIVVADVNDSDLVLAVPSEVDGTFCGSDVPVPTIGFAALPDTWRVTNAGSLIASRGDLGSYLNPSRPRSLNGKLGVRRVADRPDLTPFLPYGD